LYDELEEQMFTRTDSGQLLLTTNNLVKNLRLLQIASSSAEVEVIPSEDPLVPDEWKVTLVEPSSKIDILVEVIEENEGRSLVASAMSRQLIELAAARLDKLKIPHVLITGNVSEYDRRENLQLFQSGRVKVLLFTSGAGGTGVDMTAADTLVRLQRSWSMLENVQTLGRIDRIGAEVHSSLNVIDVIAPDTVELDQLQKLREKEERFETIVRDRVALAAAGLDTTGLDTEYTIMMGSSLLPEVGNE
jgi:SNF2 family DNA or RNA helicase